MEAPRKLHGLARIWDGEVVPFALDRLDPTVEAVFLALPEASAADLAPDLLARGLRVIDLSGAFRLRDAAARQRWYPTDGGRARGDGLRSGRNAIAQRSGRLG